MLKATDFGALGDGAAIQAALNALPAGSTWTGDAVYVPAGQWSCNAPLVIPAGVFAGRLYGDGLSTQLLKNFSTGQPLLTFAAGDTREFWIEDLALNCEGLPGDALLIQNAVSPRVRRVGIYNFTGGASGIVCEGEAGQPVSDTILENIEISSAGNGYAGIKITPRTVDISLAHIRMNGNFVVKKCLAIQQSGDVQATDLHIYNAAENVLFIDGSVGAMDFANCTFDNATKDTAWIDGTVHPLSGRLRFTACEFQNPGAGYQGRVLKGAMDIAFDPRQVLCGASIGAINGGQTKYLGSNGQQPNEADTYVMAGQSGTIFAVRVEVVDQPGAGKTFTYTLRKNDADTPITGQIVNGWWATTLTGNVAIQANDRLSLKVVTSSGAVATRHRWNFAIEG